MPFRKGSGASVSKPKPLVTGRRPTLNRTFSPWMTDVSPSFSTVTSPPFTAVTLCPKQNLTPRLAYSACNISDSSLSIGPRILSSISTTCTSVPMLLKKEANSMPITPPPMITSEAGSSLDSNASRLVQYSVSANPGMGGMTVSEPVQISRLAAS